jgi:hypothetical protein
MEVGEGHVQRAYVDVSFDNDLAKSIKDRKPVRFVLRAIRELLAGWYGLSLVSFSASDVVDGDRSVGQFASAELEDGDRLRCNLVRRANFESVGNNSLDELLKVVLGDKFKVLFLDFKKLIKGKLSNLYQNQNARDW